MYYLTGTNPPVFSLELFLEIADQANEPALNALIPERTEAAERLSNQINKWLLDPDEIPPPAFNKREVKIAGIYDRRKLTGTPLLPSELAAPSVTNRFKYDSQILTVQDDSLGKDTMKVLIYPFLHVMALSGAFGVVKSLVDAGAPIDERAITERRTALHCACRGGHEDVANLLLEAGADILAGDADGTSVVSYAASWSSPSLLKRLIQDTRGIRAKPFRPNNFGKRPLHFAAAAGNERAVRLLLDQGADPRVTHPKYRAFSKQWKRMEPMTPLQHAVEKGHESTAIALVEGMRKWQGNVSFQMWDDKTPLHYAAHHGYEDLVWCLLNSGANVKAVDEKALTPLHEAVFTQKTNLMIIAMLLEHGADPTARSSNGLTPFHHAMEDYPESIDVITLLLQGNPRWEPDHVNTRLWEAARSGLIRHFHLPFLSSMFRQDFALTAWNKDGNTPLHQIVIFSKDKHRPGWKEIAKILIDAGANIAQKDKYGSTPFECAVREFSSGSWMAPWMLEYAGIHGDCATEHFRARRAVDEYFRAAPYDTDEPWVGRRRKRPVDFLVGRVEDEELKRRTRRLLGKMGEGEGGVWSVLGCVGI